MKFWEMIATREEIWYAKQGGDGQAAVAQRIRAEIADKKKEIQALEKELARVLSDKEWTEVRP